MSFSHYVISHFSYFNSFLFYKKAFKNYFHVTLNILRKKFPITVITKTGQKIVVHTQGDSYAAARGGREFYEIDKNGVYTIKVNDSFNNVKLHTYNNVKDGIFPPFFTDIWLQSKMNGKKVVDIGAWIGDTSIAFIANGATQVIALEPLKDSYELAKKNIEINNLSSKIELLFAVCDSEDGFIFVNPNAESTIQADLKISSDGIKIPKFSLDSLISKYTIENGILKMNCEGCEYNIILKTPKEILRKFEYIVIEYHYGYANLIKRLRESGFDVEITGLPIFSYNPHSTPNKMYIGKIVAKRI